MIQATLLGCKWETIRTVFPVDRSKRQAFKKRQGHNPLARSFLPADRTPNVLGASFASSSDVIRTSIHDEYSG
jgi:hypothetical protein